MAIVSSKAKKARVRLLSSLTEFKNLLLRGYVPEFSQVSIFWRDSLWLEQEIQTSENWSKTIVKKNPYVLPDSEDSLPVYVAKKKPVRPSDAWMGCLWEESFSSETWQMPSMHPLLYVSCRHWVESPSLYKLY